jgi:transketolase
MRKEFVDAALEIALKDEKVVFISGDLGFMALESLRDSLGERFINCGVAEQNMISIAAGFAAKGFKPIAYSIAPFATLRPYEQIRNDIALHNLPVVLVGNGGGYGYGIMGATHHALEDIGVMRALPNFSILVPAFTSDVSLCVGEAFNSERPSYLRLGKAVERKDEWSPPRSFKGIDHVLKGDGVTVVTIGPIIENVIKCLDNLPANHLDLYSLKSLPLQDIPSELKESITRTQSLVVVEEHMKAGGLGELLAHLFMEAGVRLKCFKSFCALGYPSGRYGSQSWHQHESGLSSERLKEEFLALP